MKEALKVYLWGKEIGRLAWHKERNTSYFIYNQEFLQGNLDIAPLVASIHEISSTRAIFGEEERIYQKLPSFIADSLPDAWGNQLFEQWRKENHISAKSVTPLEKLAFIGKRGMGALEFVPEIDRGKSDDKINIKALADLAEKIMRDRENIKITLSESTTMQSLIAVGTSAGGRQPKGIISINKQTGEIRSGQIEAEEGFEYYILKFGDRIRCTAELEQTYYEMARASGINMMDSKLLEVDGTIHFLTKRFDRNNGKIHTQTLAAIYPESDSYESLLMVCRKLNLPEVDCKEVFRRLVFNILANNTDDHKKNFSFIMDRTGNWRLSPAYDLTYIFDTGGYLPNEDHCLMIGGKYKNISKEDIIAFAKDGGICQPEKVISKVAEAIKEFRSLATKNRVKEEWIGRIESCLNKHLSDWGFSAKEQMFSYQDESGRQIDNAHLEASYKGNYHLAATIDGKDRKYIIRKGTPQHQKITELGFSNMTESTIRELVSTILTPNK
ncbi:MAG: type II toxin-antitoxin system HipA family toxin [Bacteroidales bacterium]|nr:type II toxin-antitoxin system HipA family toxin [Bacteroidales bacterium]